MSFDFVAANPPKHGRTASQVCHAIAVLFIAANMLIGTPKATWGDEPASVEFDSKIRPILTQYCDSCHSGDSPEAKLDTSLIPNSRSVSMAWDTWQSIVDRVVQGEMPPADASHQPSDEERARLIEWTRRFRRAEAERMQGDPGPTGIRRLSNSELNYTIRDLTGVDIQPTRNFPVDPANEAGFDNSSESLTISPALVTKYLDAAREVASQMLLTPSGIRFAPHPVQTDTDRDKYCVQRIVDFYRQQPTKLEDYLLACWQLSSQFTNRVGDKQIDEVATKRKLSNKYLKLVWHTLNGTEASYGPLAKLRERWTKFTREVHVEKEAMKTCKRLALFVQDQRLSLTPRFENLQGPRGLNGGSQTLVLAKNRLMANHRRTCRDEDLSIDAKNPLLEPADLKSMETASDEQKAQIIAAYKTFCSVFPDAFYIAERGRAHIDEKEARREGQGRLLSAGFHSMMGYFRDDRPLCELILTDEAKRELDELWRELDFITLAPIRQYSGFIWFERAESSFINDEEFNFVRAEDRSATSDEMIRRFAELYLAKAERSHGSLESLEAIQFYFEDMRRQIRDLERELEKAEPSQLESLLKFAERAARRPMSNDDRQRWEQFYRNARQLPGADHRSAMEDTLVAILVSPDQLYRWDLRSSSLQPTPLDSFELASRLSYFLWSSLPDETLLVRAKEGSMTQPDVLNREMHRMLDDSRSRGMAVEFLGNWLDFRRFHLHNGVDRSEFISFDDNLRQAMADEPVEFFLDLVRRDGSILELLRSDHIIVNKVLAKHYGIPGLDFENGPTWQRVDESSRFQRGGLVPMGVFLTQNSPGLRTSPVKRGYWVVRKLLGEKIPPPPPNVPELPASEHQLGELTLRELLAKHREHPSCAACHNRFDAAGLLLEGFDPIGRPREKDLGGRTIATDATLPNGTEANGLAGLNDYILKDRVEDFRRHFCQSLLAYGLGRTLIVSDDLLVEDMLSQLDKNQNRIQTAFQVIVQSPQFRNKRSAARSLQETPDVSSP